MIKYWIKLWSSNTDLFDEIDLWYRNKKFDFVELYIVPWTFDSVQLEKIKDVPVSIHCPHSMHSFNPIDIDSDCEKIWDESILPFIEFHNPSDIIMHPELWNNLEILKQRLSYFNDDRIMIENMPKYPLPWFEWEFYWYTFIQLDKIYWTWHWLCLDFWKAAKAAIAQDIDQEKYIEEFISRYGPKYFHISWFDLINKYDQHLNLWDWDIEFLKLIKEKLNKIAENKEIKLVFETPKWEDWIENDIKNLEYFKKV